jgi:hypothetical protein
VTPDKVNPPPEGGWESLKVDELKEELEARGLPKSGTKAELIARLADDDVAQAGTAPATAAEKEAEPDDGDAAPDDGDRLQPVPAADSEEAQEAGEDAAAAADADEEAAEEAGDEEPEAKKPRRRGSAETSTGPSRRQRAPRPEGDLIVRARALGRATKIAKRTSHMTIELTTEGNGR